MCVEVFAFSAVQAKNNSDRTHESSKSKGCSRQLAADALAVLGLLNADRHGGQLTEQLVSVDVKAVVQYVVHASQFGLATAYAVLQI